MAIFIHSTHRVLAHLYRQFAAGTLSPLQGPELVKALRDNAELVQKIDGLKEAAYAAECIKNKDLVRYFCDKLYEMEAQSL
ncbi:MULTISPECIES: DUF7667 family protein [unclassified Paenibacillus]|uniref:DUF7667 family protein n=1 Tax=unclassified Paenibacillus TaxID=185978 RepID=UPI0030F6B041